MKKSLLWEHINISESRRKNRENVCDLLARPLYKLELSRPTTAETPSKFRPDINRAPLGEGGCFFVRSSNRHNAIAGTPKNLYNQSADKNGARHCSMARYKCHANFNQGENTTSLKYRKKLGGDKQHEKNPTWSDDTLPVKRLATKLAGVEKRHIRKSEKRRPIQVMECLHTPEIPRFNNLSDSQLHFGTRIAIETRSGKFLVQRRATLPHAKPYFVSIHLEDRNVGDIFSFRLVDLNNIGSRRPVKWNDKIWLQVESTGENIINIVAPKVHQAESLPSVRLGGHAGSFRFTHLSNLQQRSYGTITAVQTLAAKGAKLNSKDCAVNRHRGEYIGHWILRKVPECAYQRLNNQKSLGNRLRENENAPTAASMKLTVGLRTSSRLKDRSSEGPILNSTLVLLEQDFFNLAVNRAGSIYLNPRNMAKISEESQTADTYLRVRILEDETETGMSNKQQMHLEISYRALLELQDSIRSRSGARKYISDNGPQATPIFSGDTFTKDLRIHTSSTIVEMEKCILKTRVRKERVLAQLKRETVAHGCREQSLRECSVYDTGKDEKNHDSRFLLNHGTTVAKRWPQLRDNPTAATTLKESASHKSLQVRMQQFATSDEIIVDEISHSRNESKAPNKRAEAPKKILAEEMKNCIPRASQTKQNIGAGGLTVRNFRRVAGMHTRSMGAINLVQDIDEGARQALNEFFQISDLEDNMQADDKAVSLWLKWHTDKKKIQEILKKLNEDTREASKIADKSQIHSINSNIRTPQEPYSIPKQKLEIEFASALIGDSFGVEKDDRKKVGILNTDEKAIYNPLQCSSQTRDEAWLRKILNVVDDDGSGYLDALEIERGLLAAGAGTELSSSVASLLIKKFDSSKDGRLDFEEFKGLASVYLGTERGKSSESKVRMQNVALNDTRCIDIPRAIELFQKDVGLLATTIMACYVLYRRTLEHDLSSAVEILDTPRLLRICNVMEESSVAMLGTGLKESIKELRQTTRT